MFNNRINIFNSSSSNSLMMNIFMPIAINIMSMMANMMDMLMMPMMNIMMVMRRYRMCRVKYISSS